MARVTNSFFRQPWHVYGSTLLGGVLCGVAVVHTWLLSTIAEPRTTYALAVQLLQPLAALGTFTLVIAAVYREQRSSRRWAAALLGGGYVLTGIGLILQIYARWQGHPIATEVTTACFIATYIVSFIGGGLYFPRWSWREGNTLRVIVDSVTIGLTVLVVLRSATATMTQLCGYLFQDQLTWIALDCGFLFTLVVLSLRYQTTGNPLLHFSVLSVFCLMLGDIVFTIVACRVDAELWFFIPGPLYTLYRVFLAMGIYRSVNQPLPDTPKDISLMPVPEWLAWTQVPRVLVLIAWVCAVWFGGIPVLMLVLLAVVVVVREVLAAIDQRNIQSELNLARTTLAERNQELLAINARLAQARHLVRAVQHELRGHTRTLSGIVTGLRTMQSHPQPKSASLLRILQRNVGTLDDLVQQLLLLSQDDPPAPIRKAPVPLRALLAQAADTMQETLPRPNLTIHIKAPADLAIHADPLALTLALRTALRNAIQAIDDHRTAQPATITLHAQATATAVQLCIRDSGPGFAPAVLARLRAQQHPDGFTPGVSSRPDGHGLGLAVLDQVARRHGGTLTFGNTATGGAWVALTLPCQAGYPALSSEAT